MTYIINFKPKAFKSLARINDPHYSAIKDAIYSLKDDPRPHGYKKLVDRTGYRIRVGDYRVIYDILDQELIIDVIDLGHRKDVYG